MHLHGEPSSAWSKCSVPMKTELVVRARCSASSTTAWAFGENSWLFELSAIGLQERD